jgi:helicase MOV-10
VETIKQILHRDPNAKVLACAPSNDAADLIAQRLIDIPNSKTNLFRLNATSRPKNLLPKNLIPYSQIDEMGFAVPNVATLSTFRVIISTCVSASMVHGIGVPRGHFAYILVDEAGQAMEPEVMIPIKTMADQNTNIILSGDPKQLGPIIHSSVAEPLGLGVSYLDRLMGLDMYEPHQGHGIT